MRTTRACTRNDAITQRGSLNAARNTLTKISSSPARRPDLESLLARQAEMEISSSYVIDKSRGLAIASSVESLRKRALSARMHQFISPGGGSQRS
jgi:hypothetical protein